MKLFTKLYTLLTSYRTMAVELLLYALVMGLATFIESRMGTPAARAMVYNSAWFYLLQLLLVVNFIGISVRLKLAAQKKWGALILHYSFALILVGAFITRTTGVEGMMHIREGESVSTYMSQESYLILSTNHDGKAESFRMPLRYSLTGKAYVQGDYQLGDKKLTVRTIEYCTRCAMMGTDKLTIDLSYGDNTTRIEILGGAYMNQEPLYMNYSGVSMAFSFGSEDRELPFSVTLEDFRLVRYPGSGSPSSYESDILINSAGVRKAHKIYMNNVVHVDGYRLYQSSYDPDEGGTILSVNHDMAGMVTTYAGYILLLIGMILSLIHPHSRFRVLLRMLGKNSVVAIALFMACGISSASAQEANTLPQAEQQQAQQPTRDLVREKRMAPDYVLKLAAPAGTAERFGSLMVQTPQGRIEPIDTYAAKLLRKISRESNYRGLNPDQVVLGILTQPFLWSRIEFIKVGNDALLAKAGGGRDGYISFLDVLDSRSGDYIFADEVEATHAKPTRERNKYDKELLKLDEKINILNALFNGQFISIYPHEGDPNHKWYSPGDDLSAFSGQDSVFVSKIFGWMASELESASESGDWEAADKVIGMIDTYQHAKSESLDINKDRIKAEITYNRLNIFKWSGFAYMGTGLLLLIVLIIGLLRDSKTVRIISISLSVAVIAIFLWQSFGLALRWYISERAPWSNSYESMVYVGWVTVLSGIFFVRRSRMTLALAAFFGGVILFVSNLSWMDPEITPLVPVLQSYWLIVHVAVITGSYGFFGIGFLLGLISMLIMIFRTSKNSLRLDRQIRELTTINELALTIGLVLMTAGIFLGAVWANESWGRYWGWDPKETWALITMVVYAFVLHARFIPTLRGTYIFNLMSVIALASVLMTFFGVNHYLSGLHSYGGDSAPPALNAIFIAYGVVAVVALLAGLRHKR